MPTRTGTIAHAALDTLFLVYSSNRQTLEMVTEISDHCVLRRAIPQRLPRGR